MSLSRNTAGKIPLSQFLTERDLDEPEIRALVRVAEQSPSTFIQRQARHLLVQKLLDRQQHPFTTNATEGATRGTLTLGYRPTGDPVQIPADSLTRHLLTIGQSGAGKTTFFYTLVSQLDIPFWSFDLKQDYRHLVTELDDLLVLPWTELQFNPLVPPPGVPPRRWAQVVSEMFGHATALLSGSKNHLLKTILELYRLYDLFEECSPPYPSLHELEDVLVQQKISYVRKTSNYRDTVLNRVEAMNLGAGTIFDCSEGYPLEGLLERNVVFEFDGLNRDAQNFLMEVLLAWVYEYRLAQTQRSSGLNHVVVLDEGKQVFSVYKERQDAAGIPAIDELTAKLREFGEGLIVGDQEASKLTDSIKANTYTKLLLPTGDRRQFDAMADSMHLSDRQQHAAQQLDVGEAILQTGNKPPRRLSLPAFAVAKELTDADVRASQGAAWASLSATPRHRPSGFEAMFGSTAEADVDGKEILDDPATTIELSGDADHLLEHVLDHPFASLTERYASMTSRHVGHDAKTELVDAGLVFERPLSTGEGRARKLLELTDRGRTYVEEVLERDPRRHGRGGIVHRYWQQQVKEVFETAGWAVALELFDADVYVNTGQLEIAVEIAMENTEREREHVEKHLERGVDVLWIVCRSGEVREGLEHRFAEADLEMDAIVFREVSDIHDIDLS